LSRDLLDYETARDGGAKRRMRCYSLSEKRVCGRLERALPLPRRIPFARRSPARSFKRVLWGVSLRQNDPPERFDLLTLPPRAVRRRAVVGRTFKSSRTKKNQPTGERPADLNVLLPRRIVDRGARRAARPALLALGGIASRKQSTGLFSLAHSTTLRRSARGGSRTHVQDATPK